MAIQDLFDIMLMFRKRTKYAFNDVGIQGIRGLEWGLNGPCKKEVKNRRRESCYRYDPYLLIIRDRPDDLEVRVEDRGDIPLYIALKRDLREGKYLLNCIA